MNDWKSDLKILADKMREQQKNTKGVPHKGDSLENFRGKKGFISKTFAKRNYSEILTKNFPKSKALKEKKRHHIHIPPKRL